MNLTFRSIFVWMVCPVNPIFRRIPGLCRTENMPKLPSFNVNPSVPRLLSRVISKLPITASMACEASFLVGNDKAEAFGEMLRER